MVSDWLVMDDSLWLSDWLVVDDSLWWVIGW